MSESESLENEGQVGEHRREEKCLSFAICRNSSHNFDCDPCQFCVLQIFSPQFLACLLVLFKDDLMNQVLNVRVVKLINLLLYD